MKKSRIDGLAMVVLEQSALSGSTLLTLAPRTTTTRDQGRG